VLNERVTLSGSRNRLTPWSKEIKAKLMSHDRVQFVS